MLRLAATVTVILTSLLVGYCFRDGAEQTVIALYYPDPASAERDAGEMDKRWKPFRFETGASGYEDVVSPATCAHILSPELLLLQMRLC